MLLYLLGKFNMYIEYTLHVFVCIFAKMDAHPVAPSLPPPKSLPPFFCNDFLAVP